MSRGVGFKKLITDANRARRYVCVGLDSDRRRLPTAVSGSQLAFNQAIVDETAEFAAAYKPNSAFYESEGPAGIEALAETISYIHSVAPASLVILDCKRGDIGSTNKGYVEAAFQAMGADAVTIHPYLGYEAMQEFLSDSSRGAFVLCRTSNPGAGELQDLRVTSGDGATSSTLYEKVATNVRDKWNQNGNCGLVVGATYPAELSSIRSLVPSLPFLIPGIGAQGGDLEATISSSDMRDGAPTLINSSRGIIFASNGADFARAAGIAARELHQQISVHLES